MAPPDDDGPEYGEVPPRPPLYRAPVVRDTNDTTGTHRAASPNFGDMLAMARAQEQARQDGVDREHTAVLWREYEARQGRRKVVWGMVIAIITGACVASAPPAWLAWILNLWRVAIP